MKSIKKPKILCAMSGGVDSSVAATLLQKKGYEVIGITFKLFCYAKTKTQKKACCSLEAICLAREVCRKLGISHYVVDVSKKFEKEIIKNFINEYIAGRTPNPCIHCNQLIKFPVLISYAKKLGINFVSTGHYARIKNDKNGYHLLKAKDNKKDQTYFLWTLTQDQLKHILLPIGDYKKTEIRKLAKKFDLPVAGREESQEICFVPNDYRKFLNQKAKKFIKKGPIFDVSGKKLGIHNGLVFYTVGQRTGLGISAYNPLYVLELDTKNNALVVDEDEFLYKKELIASEINFIAGKIPQKSLSVKAKIRYGMEAQKGKILVENKKASIVFEKQQRAITPGQSIVFYNRNEVLGGGIIESSI
jgi:tRNA-specific 2-thiouridylase